MTDQQATINALLGHPLTQRQQIGPPQVGGAPAGKVQHNVLLALAQEDAAIRRTAVLQQQSFCLQSPKHQRAHVLTAELLEQMVG